MSGGKCLICLNLLNLTRKLSSVTFLSKKYSFNTFHPKFLVLHVDGGWSEWSQWTTCSRTCGNGRRKRKRECNNPKPHTGRFCQGKMVESELCNLGKCPDGKFLVLEALHELGKQIFNQFKLHFFSIHIQKYSIL